MGLPTTLGSEVDPNDNVGDGSPTATFEAAERDLLAQVGLDVRTSFVDLEAPPMRTRVLETGPPGDDAVPLVFVHGTAEFATFLAPLVAELPGTRTIAFDRPGYGCAEPFRYTEANLRRTVLDALEGVLDALGLETVDLVGHSAGGFTSLLFARANPDRVRRLVLVGSVPTFPGTRPPLPFRLLQVPLLDRVLERLQKPGEAGVLDFAEVFGERESIQRYPGLVRAIAAQQADPGPAFAGETELGSFVGPFGWRSSTRILESELREIEFPTLVVWGEDDPLGSPDDVRDAVETIPDARLESVPGAHAPFFGHPERCASLVRAFRDSEPA